LDISFLFADEKPAGKHDFLKTQGDRFVFEDGTPVRFWGTNLNGGAAFPEKDYAPKLARRLTSLNNDLDIRNTDSVLLTAVGDAINTDMKISDDVPDTAQPKTAFLGQPPYRKLTDFGKPPILAEVIEADISIRTDRKMAVQAIRAEGVVIGNLPVTYEKGWMKFTIGYKKIPPCIT